MGESNKNLLIYEEALMRMIPDSTSETKELLEKYLSLARIERHPFLAQSVRKDSPILKDEQIPTLLSEDMQTIQDMGNIFSRMDTMRPNRVDIEVFLANAVADGYSKVKADKFLKAWDAGGRNSCNA